MKQTKPHKNPPGTDSAQESWKKVLEAELLTDADVERKERLEKLAWLLDRSIPIPFLKMRMGIDPLIGLIPGLGDLITTTISTYLMAEASRMGVSKTTLMRMGGNILLDTLAGTVPFIGDLFDVAFKANTRNVKLLNEHLNNRQQAERKNNYFVAGIAAVVILFSLLVGSLVILAFSAVIMLLRGGAG